MIIAKFVEDSEGKLFSFEITGHAGFADEGEDIVCSAVSVLAIETVNNIDRLASHQMIVEEADAKGGYLFAEVRSNLSEEANYITQILLKHLFYSLQDVSEAYSDYIQLQVTIQ